MQYGYNNNTRVSLYVWEENKCLDECNATHVSSIQMNLSESYIITYQVTIYFNLIQHYFIFDRLITWNQKYKLNHAFKPGARNTKR